MALLSARLLPLSGLERSSWKLSAFINTIAVACFSIILLGVLIYGFSRGKGINSAFFLYQGDCATSTTINFIAHLIINTLGTLILASSNFFMQIVSAPSREELNRAHSLSQWVDIGVPSIRNVPYLSRLKRWSWLALALSSVPIHFFLNSTTFLIQSSNSVFTATWAGEPFVRGGDYYPPGVTLWNMDVPINCTHPANETIRAECSKLPVIPNLWAQTNNISMSDYLNKSSIPSLRLAKASRARRDGWVRLDVEACRRQYAQCGYGSGLQKYRDVVFIIEKTRMINVTVNGEDNLQPTQVSEWTRNEIFPNMTTRDSEFWDQLMPLTANNSLWYTAACQMTQNFTTEGLGFCSNTCAKFLGYRNSYLGGQYDTSNSTEWSNTVAYDDDTAKLHDQDKWYFNFWDSYLLFTGGGFYENQMRSGYKESVAWIDVKYCLVEPAEDQCKVAVSNAALLIVALCVMLKTAQCFAILRSFVLREDKTPPLITPGDVVESLIRDPEQITEKMCMLTQHDVREAARPARKVYEIFAPIRAIFRGPQQSNLLDKLPRSAAREWEPPERQYLGTLSPGARVITYGFYWLTIVVGLLLFFTSLNFKVTGQGLRGQIGYSGENPFVMPGVGAGNYSGRFLDLVLLANIPQFAISLWYLQFNSLLTRLHIASEWSSMAAKYSGLRVTEPRGEQTSTYRLQLPYKWSIPSITASIILHWLVANSLYVYVADGGFYSTPMSKNRDMSIGISEAGFIGLGYSPKGIVASLVLFFVIGGAPWFFKSVPENALVVGTNSLAISAACHVAPRGIDALERKGDGQEESSTPRTPFDEIGRSLLAERREDRPASSRSSVSGDMLAEKGARTGSEALRRLTERKLMWGVVEMPREFYGELADGWNKPYKLGHLSFGCEEEGVQEAQQYHWYL